MDGLAAGDFFMSNKKHAVFIGSLEEIFAKQVELICGLGGREGDSKVVALTGGSTPKAFYQWLSVNRALNPENCPCVIWTTSDERCVELTSEDSNFGNAARGFLDPLGFGEECRRPWPVDQSPSQAAAVYAGQWQSNDATLYDLCFVGMGDDGHTLSLFPHCPLLEDDGGEPFAAVEWPGRGWRLTLTPTGLKCCRMVVPVITGAAKAAKLAAILNGDGEVKNDPVRLLHSLGKQVLWLVDHSAAAQL